ncbi:hypothetical protein IPF89_00905 [Candidatus Saccharibacteria bacterium]|nr:MAG: hypothetical protein IPF89_00905 [Candidatus Saccharibacteria bacterium]
MEDEPVLCRCGYVANLIGDLWTFTTDGRQNCAPTDIGLTNTIVTENTTPVGTLSSVDPDVGNTFTYSLVTGTGDEDNARI